MTTYRRSGHWRRGKNGQLHWVSAHSVNRTHSSSGFWRSPPPKPVHPPAVKWGRLPTEPNAACPLCGAAVYFYRNERGGCAYFDALGPPWPKHPCMDSPFRFDAAAGRAAMRAYAQWQRRADITALREARRGARERRAERGRARESEHLQAWRWTLGWWTGFAMLLAWCGSVPLTIAIYAEQSEVNLWGLNLIVGMPTVVSLLALLRFLCRARRTKPTAGRVLGAVLSAPLLLAVGLLAFLFSAGLGAIVFAWFLSRHGGSADESVPVAGVPVGNSEPLHP